MEFQLSWINTLNILILVIVVWTMVKSTKQGLLLGLVYLLRMIVALIFAMVLAGPLAEVFPLLNFHSGSTAPLIAQLLSVQASRPIWFVIVFVVVLIISKLLELVIKFIEHTPIVGSLNRAGGVVLGVIITWFQLILLMWVFTTSIFTNGHEVIENSYLRYVKQSISYVNFIVEPMEENVIIQKYRAGENMSEEQTETIESWLTDQGLGHDQIVDFLEGIKNE